MKKDITKTRGEVIIYKAGNKERIQVKLENETVWLTQKQIAELFQKELPTINEHISHIFREGELKKRSVIRKFRITGSDGKRYLNTLYNLDVIISVGYRVKSQRGTQFRIWATRTLRDYLIKGFTINQRRLLEQSEKLAELQKTITFLKEKSSAPLLADQAEGLLSLLQEYANSLTLIHAYDTGTLKSVPRKKPTFSLTYKQCYQVITQARQVLAKNKEAGPLFGQEYQQKFQGIAAGLYQTFGGKELYRTVEEKAAHLLYLTIKDHPFADGNKRIASILFVYFLESNKFLYRTTGERKITDMTLVALALLIAMSNPKEKDLMIKLVMNLLK